MSTFFSQLEAWHCDVVGTLHRFGGNASHMTSCIIRYTASDDFVQLKESMQTQRYEDAFIHAHSIKGVVANLGITPLYEAVTPFVEALRTKDYTRATALYQTVEHEYSNLRSLVHNHTPSETEHTSK